MILISLSQQKRGLPWKVFVLVVMVGKRGGYSGQSWEREREKFMTEEIGDPFYATKSRKSTETILSFWRPIIHYSKDAFSGQR